MLLGVRLPNSKNAEWCRGRYFKAGSRAGYAQTCGVDELKDRLDCFAKGCAPQLWPSFDRIHYYPKRFQNFPKILQGYIDKMPPGHPSIQTRRTHKGHLVPHLEPVLDPDYVSPKLSELGLRLLGKKSWDDTGDGLQLAAQPQVQVIELSSDSSSDSDDNRPIAQGKVPHPPKKKRGAATQQVQQAEQEAHVQPGVSRGASFRHGLEFDALRRRNEALQRQLDLANQTVASTEAENTSLKRKVDDMEAQNQCVICYEPFSDSNKRVAIIPCGHTGMCKTCLETIIGQTPAWEVPLCPRCRGLVHSWNIMYL